VELRAEIGAAIPLLVELLLDWNDETSAAAASALAKMSENGALHVDLTV
jgi:HEAT repeat protein